MQANYDGTCVEAEVKAGATNDKGRPVAALSRGIVGLTEAPRAPMDLMGYVEV